MNNVKVTVFTPAYNRGNTIERVFKSLTTQTFKDFEWIIIDDGSTDNTEEIVKNFEKQPHDFPITYKYQKNHGKHIAQNRAVQLAKGEFFITLDSDDYCKDETLEVFLNEWDKIPPEQQPMFYGITCRCCDSNGDIIGSPMSAEYVDCNDLDFRYKYNITGELWGISRTNILKEFPYPEIEGLHFYPENILWNTVGKKYISRRINKALRYYINDTDNALTNSKKYAPLKETFYMRSHYINDCWDYAKYDRKKFLSQIIGLSRDGLACGYKFSEIKKIPNTFSKKALTVLFYPMGYILWRFKK